MSAAPATGLPELFARVPVSLRLAVTKREAAQLLSVGIDHFEEHILPELRVIYRGRRVIVPLRELDRWLENEAEAAHPGRGPAELAASR